MRGRLRRIPARSREVSSGRRRARRARPLRAPSRARGRHSRRRERDSPAGAPKQADPGASALATYLGLLGFRVEPTLVTELLVLVGVLGLEVGSALSVLLVRAGGIGPQGALGEPLAPAEAVQRATAVAEDRPLEAPVGPSELGVLTLGIAAKTGPKDATTTRRRGRPSKIPKAAPRKSEFWTPSEMRAGSWRQAAFAGWRLLIGGKRSTVHNALLALVATGLIERLGDGAVILRA